MDPASSRQNGDSLRGMERKGADGNVAFRSADKPPTEISPGPTSLKHLVPSEPKSTIVQGVKWVVPAKGVPGHLIFPSSFSGEIATDLATPDNVRYYNGAEIANKTNRKVDVHMLHFQHPFEYEPDYLQNYVMDGAAGGATLERHDFCHTDTPSKDGEGDQGIFVMGKFLNKEETEIELTGFKIPRGDTLFVPKHTIHTNNYLKGEWTTMLSVENPVEELVKMVKDDRSFHFTFKWVLSFVIREDSLYHVL